MIKKCLDIIERNVTIFEDNHGELNLGREDIDQKVGTNINAMEKDINIS